MQAVGSGLVGVLLPCLTQGSLALACATVEALLQITVAVQGKQAMVSCSQRLLKNDVWHCLVRKCTPALMIQHQKGKHANMLAYTCCCQKETSLEATEQVIDHQTTCCANVKAMSGQLPILVELLEGAPPHLTSCLVELICNCAELPAARKVPLLASQMTIAHLLLPLTLIAIQMMQKQMLMQYVLAHGLPSLHTLPRILVMVTSDHQRRSSRQLPPCFKS